MTESPYIFPAPTPSVFTISEVSLRHIPEKPHVANAYVYNKVLLLISPNLCQDNLAHCFNARWNTCSLRCPFCSIGVAVIKKAPVFMVITHDSIIVRIYIVVFKALKVWSVERVPALPQHGCGTAPS